MLASFAASAAWLGPWIVLLLFLAERDNDNAAAYGWFLLVIPVALGVGALVWRTIGAVLRDGPPPLSRFMIRGALLVSGFVLVIRLWSLWGIWNAPPPVRWEEEVLMALAGAVALGLSALPAAALWWRLAIRPTMAAPANQGEVPTGS